MEKLLFLMKGIFQQDLGVDAFLQDLGFLFNGTLILDDEECELLFKDLGNMLDARDKVEDQAMGKLFLFLAGLGYAANRRISARLWLDKALLYIDGPGPIKGIKKYQQDTFDAFLPYQSQTEAFEDYLFLFTNMARGVNEDNDDGLVTERHLGELYKPSLEMGFFEDIADAELGTPREFWDYLRYVRLREDASDAAGMAYPYLDLARKFDLTTLHLMTLVFLYFSATSSAFIRLMEDLAGDTDMFPSVGLLDRLVQRTFGVNSVAKDTLSSQGLLCRWGMVHLQSPEGMGVTSIFHRSAVLDDAVVLFLRDGSPGEDNFLQKERIQDVFGMPSALDTKDEIAGLLQKGSARLFIHNTGGLGVADELFLHLNGRFDSVSVFSLDRVLSADRAFRMEAIKSAFLVCKLQNSYPLFELAGGYNDQERRSLRLCLQDQQDVASRLDSGFAITSFDDLFDLVYQSIGDIGYFSLQAPVGRQQEAMWEYWLDRFSINLDPQDKKKVLRTFPRVRLNVRVVLSKLRNNPNVDFETIKSTVYQGMDADFGFSAQRITPVFDWDSIVLPEETLVRVNEIITFYRYKNTVMEDWGFGKKLPYGKAISAMFYGPPGTGKSMMAQVIAKDLNMDLFKVDLSSVLSKYIGETEKGLRRVFEAAQDSPTILMFDEADSLFTKRTEVNTSTDRYANVEVNYLLQKMEEFQGITILTTNNYGNIDEAFKRRIRFKIKFPVPDVETRVRLWQVMLPSQARVDHGINFDKLGKVYDFSPAHIKNAVLRAAFMAAEKGEPISIKDLEQSAMMEAKDLGQVVRDRD